MARESRTKIWLGVAVAAVALAAAVVVLAGPGHHGSSSPPTPVMPPLAAFAARSACPPDTNPTDATVPPPEAGVIQSSTDGGNGPLGPGIIGAGLPNPYYEIGAPTAPGSAGHPLGLMLEIHGGGWVKVGPNTTKDLWVDADFWRSRGWETINIDYRGCWRSLPDVLGFYTRVRTLFPHKVICASGQSSGGTLALVLAALSGRGLSCVISESGITDLAALASSTAYPSPIPGDSPAGLTAEILAAFGVKSTTELSAFDPSTYARTFTTPVLLASAANDSVIPISQAATFQNAVLAAHPGSYVQVDQLPCPSEGGAVLCQQSPLSAGSGPASVPFVHGTTNAVGLADFYHQEDRLVAYVPLAPKP